MQGFSLLDDLAKRCRQSVLLVVLSLLVGCFPSLPEERVVDNLRVLAVNVDPAMAVFDVQPPPLITVSALVVDPSDEELSEVDFTWSFDLPEGSEFEALDQLLPPTPHSDSISLNLGPVFAPPPGGGGSPDTLQAILPMRLAVVSPEDHRDTIKLVHFVVPGTEPLPKGEELVINQNPVISSISLGEQSWSVEEGTLPGPSQALYVGPIPEAGDTFEVHIEDDGDLDLVGLRLYRTAGCGNLMPEEGDEGPGGFQPPGQDPCDIDGGFGGGFGGDDDDEESDPSIRDIEWRPRPGESSQGSRLFLVIRDSRGAQSWQELRPEAAP